MKTNKQQKLFSPLEISDGKWLKNRVIMAPCTRCRAIDNLPNQLVADYYAQRASAGFIITECMFPSLNALTYPRVPGIFTEEQTNAWKTVTQAVHAENGIIFAQLNHFGRTGSPLNIPGGGQMIGASNIPTTADVWTDVQGMVKPGVPQALDAKGIKIVIQDFVNAAKNVINAGFDGIEIHGANGYLIEQFLNPYVNNRTDEYGGSFENRCRFALELTQAIADAIGPDKVGIRLSPFSELCELPPYEEVEETYEYLAENISRMKLLYIHLVDPTAGQENPDKDKMLSVRELSLNIRDIFEGLLILNGGYSKDEAILAVENQEADLISFGKAFIANPDLPFRLEYDLELTPADPATFYTPGEAGLTDYPFYNKEALV